MLRALVHVAVGGPSHVLLSGKLVSLNSLLLQRLQQLLVLTMLLQVVAELLLFLAHLDQLLVSQVRIADRTAGAHGTGAHWQPLRLQLAFALGSGVQHAFIHGTVHPATRRGEHRAIQSQISVRCGRASTSVCVPCSRLVVQHEMRGDSIRAAIVGLSHFELVPRVLLVDEIHASRLNSRLDVVALVALMVHGILWQVIDAWS